MAKVYKADLHIHTCLSPCGDLKMSPKNIIEQVLKNNIDIIAICDHNSAKNVSAVIKAAQNKNVYVIPGMEISSSEEVHILALFENIESAIEMEKLVYEKLQGFNDPDLFGMQIIANELDEVEGFEEKLLIGSVNLNINQVVDFIHQLNGLAIASHIDKQNYSVISQLGFIPENIKFDALEISTNIDLSTAQRLFKEYSKIPMLTNSDAHYIEDVGKVTNNFLLEYPSFDEIRKTLKNEGERKIII